MYAEGTLGELSSVGENLEKLDVAEEYVQLTRWLDAVGLEERWRLPWPSLD